MTFDPLLVKLTSNSSMERDEGDMDFTQRSKLKYDGNLIWSLSTVSSSNIGGAWGSEHEAHLSPDKSTLFVSHTEISGVVSTGRIEKPGNKEQHCVIKLLEAHLAKEG